MEEISGEEEDAPQVLAKKSVSQQPPQPKTESLPAPPMTDKQIGAILHDFQELHKQAHISKSELEAIVDVVREGVRGFDYNEEKFLRAQFSSDLLRLQAFIEVKMQEIIKESYVENGVNIHNKDEFPGLCDSFEEKKKKNKGKLQTQGGKKKGLPAKEPPPKPVNLLDELVADKLAKENENKTEELVTVKLHDPSENLVYTESEQPLTKWMNYEDNLFVMGNVQPCYLVYPARELLQVTQPVPRHHVQ